MQFYSKLALAEAKRGGKTVWAMDTQLSNNRLGKKFIVADSEEVYGYCRRFPWPSVYEIIQMNSRCKLYLDIELEREFTESQCDILKDFFVRTLIQHLTLSFDLNEDPSIIVLSACTENKFSLHLIGRNVVFRESQCSMYAYVSEYAAYVKHAIVDFDMDMELKLLVHERLGIDLSVYKKNQQFRLVGNTKLGKKRPLTRVPAGERIR